MSEAIETARRRVEVPTAATDQDNVDLAERGRARDRNQRDPSWRPSIPICVCAARRRLATFANFEAGPIHSRRSSSAHSRERQPPTRAASWSPASPRACKHCASGNLAGRSMIQGIPLRNWSARSALVSITTAVSVPSAYLVQRSSMPRAQWRSKARLNADGRAVYYSHGGGLAVSAAAVGQLIQLPRERRSAHPPENLRQANGLVLDEGAPWPRRVATRSIPIVVAGQTMGIFVVEESLRRPL